MLEVEIPGYKKLKLEHAFFDINGTLAQLGEVSDGAVSRVKDLSKIMSIHLMTSDTRGKGKSIAERIGFPLTIIPSDVDAVQAKRNELENMGADHTVVFGNGANDVSVLKDAALGIVVLGEYEGASTEAISAGDVVVRSIEAAIDLLLDPLRIVAALRR